MKICTGCGAIGYHKDEDLPCKDINFVVIHNTHVVHNNQFCLNCNKSNATALIAPCVPDPEFTIDPSHRISPKSGEIVRCENCGRNDREGLMVECRFTRHRLKFEPSSEKPQDFVWVIYYWDDGANAVSIHMTPQEAIDSIEKGMGHEIGKWPFGMNLRDAIEQWENRKKIDHL